MHIIEKKTYLFDLFSMGLQKWISLQFLIYVHAINITGYNWFLSNVKTLISRKLQGNFNTYEDFKSVHV